MLSQLTVTTSPPPCQRMRLRFRYTAWEAPARWYNEPIEHFRREACNGILRQSFQQHFRTRLARAAQPPRARRAPLKLKSKLSDHPASAPPIAAQLSASLYEATKTTRLSPKGANRSMRGHRCGRQQREALQAELTGNRGAGGRAVRLPARPHLPRVRHAGEGLRVLLPGCGKPVAEIREKARRARGRGGREACRRSAPPARSSAPTAAPIVGDADKFCQSCGKPIDREAAVAKGHAVEPDRRRLARCGRRDRRASRRRSPAGCRSREADKLRAGSRPGGQGGRCGKAEA